jgi:thiol-disulfide isomerase/thioredoxin
MSADEPTSAPQASAESTPPARQAPGRHARLMILGVGVAALAALLWPRGADGPRATGTLFDDQGDRAPLAEQLAPVTLLHFWATWCPPCIDELPTLDRLAEELAGERDFRVLMVAVEDDRDKVRRFAGAAPERVLYDPDWKVAHRYGTRQLPETHLLVNGRVVQSFIGAKDWSDPQLRAIVRNAIAQSAQRG